jgi:2-dehydropantoate 2-reductase
VATGELDLDSAPPPICRKSRTSIMRVLILGAGAMGGYFGARAIEAGLNVDFLVRPARAERLRAGGLRVSSALGNFAAPVSVHTHVPAGYSCDVVMLSCKAFDLDSAIAAIAPAVGPATRVLPLLNGLKHLDLLDLAFGRDRVWGGLAHISVTLDDAGTILHLGKLARLSFGARQPDARCDELAPALAAIRADIVRRDDILVAMWEKHALIATLAGMTCLMRASVGEIVATPDGAKLLRRAYAEAAAIAAANGHALASAVREEADAIFSTPGSSLKASMLRDLERGARTEAEHVLGDLLARGAGVDTPLLAAACAHMRAYETRRA